MDRLKIGKKLSDLRKERGETAGEVAKAVGICQGAISMYETGARVPRDDIKRKLSKHFGVSIEEIFFAE